MSTKIGSFDNSPVQVSTGRNVKRAGDSTSTSQTSKTQTTSDTQITESARGLVELEQSLQALPAVDDARVSEVSARIAKGEYQIDPERIADKLLAAEQYSGRIE